MEDIIIVCTSCPLGCKISIEKCDSGYKVIGNNCRRGEVYVIEELTNPKRIVTSTVKINKSSISRLPVRTDKPISKEKIFDCINEINKVEICAPVNIEDIIISNILGTNANLVASRSMKKTVRD
ncbi:DUF1667 domain-containing protein [Sporosalibacterium faouarense]|uniref:DUF1667 domain-containing protein n=1 Tax=Sporosalibacterium faouarense TaxID=516123 RepID=UPI00141CFF77|nr:DUF1667 domain-containing protein [Sporosalibacterium faouarense]MTI49599.1 DUF1667 domain-containing protein [Bacillota bacterium]